MRRQCYTRLGMKERPEMGTGPVLFPETVKREKLTAVGDWMWEENGEKSSVVYGHTTLSVPDLILSHKLSSAKSG